MRVKPDPHAQPTTQGTDPEAAAWGRLVLSWPCPLCGRPWPCDCYSDPEPAAAQNKQESTPTPTQEN